MSTVTVGVDGSLPARRAVRVAAREAALRGLPLRIASATWWPEIQERPSRDFEPPDRRALADIDAALLRPWPRTRRNCSLLFRGPRCPLLDSQPGGRR